MNHGDKETAQRLQSAIHENFTTSEVLDELAIALEALQLEKNNTYLEPRRVDISDEIYGIRMAFRKANHPG